MRWIIAILFFLFILPVEKAGAKSFEIGPDKPTILYPGIFSEPPVGGDTIFILTSRKKAILFENFEGAEEAPIVILNKGGQVNIDDQSYWAALHFKHCSYLKVLGSGSDKIDYGFLLSAKYAGVIFEHNSTNCELGFVKIDHEGFVGIQVKDDYHGNPPNPLPVFEKLAIHDCFITNVTEGMYLGETVSPGLEFNHVRIYNNIICNVGREGIQVANMVEDVEVYNNIIYNTGKNQLFAQGNGLQVGDNTTGRFYRNIIVNTFEYGIICLGSGDINLSENYLQNTHGIFVDNRTISYPDAPISINNNYFFQSVSTSNVNILNEINPLEIKNNIWYGTGKFLNYSSGLKNLVEENNIFRSFIPLAFENPEQGYFRLRNDNSSEFKAKGPQPALGYQYNYAPKLEPVGDQVVNWETVRQITISATTEDGDPVQFSLSDSLDFTSLTNLGNGTAILNINPSRTNKGIYYSTIVVSDRSHNSKARERIKIAVKNPANQDPRLSGKGNLFIQALKKNTIPINYFDADDDSVHIYSVGLPDFGKIVYNKKEKTYFSTELELNGGFLEEVQKTVVTVEFYYLFEFEPRYIDAGFYPDILLIADDGYGNPDTLNFNLSVFNAQPVSGSAIYRVNCGGPELNDEPISWEDSYHQELPYEYTANHKTGSHTWSGVNATGAPDNLFGPFSYDNMDAEPMKWRFPLENGRYRINLFFSERQSDIDNSRISNFNVNIENTRVLENFSIYEESGLDALKKSFETDIEDQDILIEFTPVLNRSKVNGIEIIFLSGRNDPPNLSKINDISIYSNESKTINLFASDPESDSVKFEISNLPDFVFFNQKKSGEASIQLNPENKDIGNYNGIVVAAIDQHNLAVYDTFNIQVLYNSEEMIIPVKENQIVREYQNDDVISPWVLFDEQDSGPETLKHPASSSWKPANDFSEGPFHFFIDYKHLINVTEIAIHDMENSGEIIVSYGEPGNWKFLFEDYCDSLNAWKIHPVNIISRYVRFSMVETVESAINEILVTGIPVSSYIDISSSELVDETPGGSYQSFQLLFDEQYIDPVSNEHPVSLSWKPSYNADNAPYSAYIDFKEYFFIESAWIHDMHNSRELILSTGEPGTWKQFFNVNLVNYNYWHEIPIEYITRYFRFTMPDSPLAECNEVVFKGYPVYKNINTSAHTIPFSPGMLVYPNPVSDEINIVLPGFENKIRIELVTMEGRIIGTWEFPYATSNTLNINVTNKELKPGIYLIKAETGNTVLIEKIMVR